jgi:hypothetical protein
MIDDMMITPWERMEERHPAQLRSATGRVIGTPSGCMLPEAVSRSIDMLFYFSNDEGTACSE